MLWLFQAMMCDQGPVSQSKFSLVFPSLINGITKLVVKPVSFLFFPIKRIHVKEFYGDRIVTVNDFGIENKTLTKKKHIYKNK